VFDSHCHLTDIQNPEQALLQALSAGVRAVLTCGYDAQSNRAVCELADRYPGLPFALGLHPWSANEPVEPVLKLIERARPVAVGEAGLDFREPPEHPRERQLQVLEAQLELCVRLDLPVTLHSRKAVQQLLPVLRNHPGLRGALHAYSGSYEQARGFVDLGFFIGVGGAVTRSRAKRVRRCAAALPLDCIVLETDAPCIGMDTVEPPHVRPAHLPRVAAALAELRGASVEVIERRTDENAVRLFGPRAAVDLRGAVA
jgi:TatD DNase family protein